VLWEEHTALLSTYELDAPPPPPPPFYAVLRIFGIRVNLLLTLPRHIIIITTVDQINRRRSSGLTYDPD
jgi:hypothetical protein